MINEFTLPSILRRWQSSMSRLKVTRHSDSMKQRKAFSGIVGKATQGFCKDEEAGVPRPGVLGDLSGKVRSRPCQTLDIVWHEKSRVLF